MQCADKRRTRGLGLDVSAIDNAVWGWAGPKLTYSTLLGSRHVEFVSLDRCKEENGIRRQSLFSQATNPEADILLPYEMNGEVSLCVLSRIRHLFESAIC